MILVAWSTAKLVETSRLKQAKQERLEQKIEQLETENHSLKNDLDQLHKENLELKDKLEIAEKKLSARTSTIKYASATISDDNVCVVAAKKYFPQSEWENAKLVIQRESGGNPSAVSKTNDHGCFQIHDWAIYDPEQNAKVAYAKFINNGWRPWYAVRGILWS